MSTSTAFRLLIACLVVGAVLAFLDVSPKDFWIDLIGTFTDSMRWIVSKAGRLVGYTLSGALIVVPVWLLIRGIEWAKGHTRPAARRR